MPATQTWLFANAGIQRSELSTHSRHNALATSLNSLLRSSDVIKSVHEAEFNRATIHTNGEGGCR